jgi:hypothetical protein
VFYFIFFILRPLLAHSWNSSLNFKTSS